MKKAFTLVEMLIVVAIIAVLMSITFKLGGLGDADERRTRTVVRLQRIENCLSGYYAAFGSYPPVKLHGSRDINVDVDANGDQSTRESIGQNEGGSSLSWVRVRAACKSQPFGCEYPGDSSENRAIRNWSEELRARVENREEFPNYANSSFAEIFRQELNGPNPNQGFRSEWSNSDWKAIKLFKFGLMSFLLPRYLFMMGGDSEFFGSNTSNIGGNESSSACAQWDDNNDMPCDPFSGESFLEMENERGWQSIRNYAQNDVKSSKKNRYDLARVANIPSQAVCARWIPNLEGICCSIVSHSFFGVSITGYSPLGLDDDYPPDPDTHYPPTGSTAYKNATVTIFDGWEREFYYYSPEPYQTYVVWSAGPNGKTFPPWISMKDLQGKNRETAISWMQDDIIQMSH